MFSFSDSDDSALSSKTPVRLLLVYKNLAADRLTSSHGGLGVTAQNAARALRRLGIRVDVEGVFDGFELRDKVIPAIHPTHVVMFAPWLDTPFLQGLLRKFPQIFFSVTYHSNVGFLQADKYAIKLLREQLSLEVINDNFSLGVNCERLQISILNTFGKHVTLLPNLYEVADTPQHVYHTGDTLRLGIFGAMRPQKNMLTAAWAAAQIAHTMKCRTTITVNAGKAEGGGVLGAIRELINGLDQVTLNESPWLVWTDFRQLVAGQHLLISPSYTESFCNVTADGITEGVPSVVTTAITWVPREWQADGDDTTSIATAGIRLIRDHGSARNGYRSLRKHNIMALASWVAYLNGKPFKT